MRQPALADDPAMVPVDIVAESGPPTSALADEKEDSPAGVTATSLQPVIVGAVVYEKPAAPLPSPVASTAGATNTRAHYDDHTKEPEEEETGCVRAWAVEPKLDDNAVAADSEEKEFLSSSAAAAAAAAAADAVAIAPLSPPPQSGPDYSGEVDATLMSGRSGGVVLGSGPVPASIPTASHDDSYTIGGEEVEKAGIEPVVDSGTSSECWSSIDSGSGSEKDGLTRVKASLSWDTSVEGADGMTERENQEKKQKAEDGGFIRARRSISNLETARRRGAGLDSEITSDSTDSDDCCEESNAGGDSEVQRPRALSLDGWFTCGLENPAQTKSYETHDHAGRFRELVRLVSFLEGKGRGEIRIYRYLRAWERVVMS